MNKVPDRARPTVTSRLGVSLPAAIGALLFAGAIAFGSGMVDAVKPGDGGTQASHKGGGTGNGQSAYHKPDRPKNEDKQQPSHNRPDKTPKPEPKSSPKPASTPKPAQDKPASTPKPQNHDYTKTPKPEPAPPAQGTAMSLDAMPGLGKVKLTWTKFGGEGFAYYKVVRSTDATVSWPTGGNDTLVHWSSDKYENWFKDHPTPCGKVFFYRVFAVTSGDSGYHVLAASNVDSAAADCDTTATPKPSPSPKPSPTPAPPAPTPTPAPPTPTPAPQPVTLGFSVATADGGVELDWQACTDTGFASYRVVRSQTNPDPMYPLNAGTELLATIGTANVSVLMDASVTTGQTWHYRVLCMAGDGTLLGLTAAVSVTVP